jgi:hypothetical protein
LEESCEFIVDRGLSCHGHILGHELRRDEREKGSVVAVGHLAWACEGIHRPGLELSYPKG